MSSAYPNNLDNFSNPSSTDKQNSVTTPHAQLHANVNDALEAIQAALGILPQGGFSTVRARLEDIESDVAALGSSIVATMLDNSISGTKLQSSSVTETKLASNSVSADKIQSSAVTTSKLADSSVTANKIPADTISYDKVAHSSKILMTRVANQSVGGTSSAYISWDTKPGTVDTDGFVSALPATTISIPTGKAGLYLIIATVSGYASHANDYLQIEVSTGTANWKAGGGPAILAVALADIAVGGTVKILANNGNSSSANLTGRVMMVKLFDE
jgi:hypothetical protein